MNRLIVLGCGLLWAGAAAGQTPWKAYPPNGVRPASDVTQPLPGAVANAVAMPHSGHCAPATNGECPTCRKGGRPCLQKILDWVTFQPGPRVLPLFTPTPYQAPLRCYYPPCREGYGHGSANGCGPTTAASRAGVLSRAGRGSCPSPRVGILSRMWHFFDRQPYPYDAGMWAGQGVPCGPGTPSVGGYRFASPTGMPAPPSTPAGYTQPAVNRPFTSQQ